MKFKDVEIIIVILITVSALTEWKKKKKRNPDNLNIVTIQVITRDYVFVGFVSNLSNIPELTTTIVFF